MNPVNPEIQRLSDELLITRNAYNNFVDDVLRNAPDCWDDDVPPASVAVDYIAELERKAGTVHKCDDGKCV